MINKIAIIGMGALGLLYADQLNTGLNNSNAAYFVMDKDRAKRHQDDIYKINKNPKQFTIIDQEQATPADLVIVAVKYTALKEAIETIRTSVGENTIILSVLNGIDSEKIIGAEYGMDKMIYAVAQKMDAMRDGTALTYTNCGKLHIGAQSKAQNHNLQKVQELFERANLPHVIEKDILYRIWFKFMLNVGFNQTCMVYDAPYAVVTNPNNECYHKMVGAMREVIPLAKANGVTLTEEDIQKCIDFEKEIDPEAYPSMAQDRKAKRKSEVEMFSGEIIRQAKELGIEVPFNEFFYQKVKEIESSY